MPEGVSGIEDLKVMISADSEKLGQGITTAKDIIAKFADATGKDMGRFEGYLDRAGSKVEFFRGKIGGWVAAFEMVRATIEKVVAQGQQFADETGTQDSYKQVTDAWTSMKEVLDSTLGRAFAENKDKASAFSAALSSSDENSVTSALGRLQTRAISFSETGMKRLAGILTDLTIGIDSFSATSERRLSTLQANIEDSVDVLKKIDQALREIEASGGRASDDLRKRLSEYRGGMLWSGFWDQTKFLRERQEQQTQELEREEESYRLRVRRMQLEREKIQEETAESWEEPSVTDDRADAHIKAAQALDRETEALRRRAQAIGMTAGQRAEFEALNKALDAIPNPTPEQIADLRKRAAALREQSEETGRLTDAEKQRQGLTQITNSMERELDGMQRRILLTREAAGAAEEMAAREKALTLAQQRNIELSPEMIASIDAYAARIGAAARELDAMKKQLDLFKETGQLVARSLEGAFRQWTEGSKVDVREMVRSMLADLAMLTFRKNVSDVLGGGITSGLQSLLMGGGGVAIAGAGGWQTSVKPTGFLEGLFDGFRADGGPVEAGRMYMVGERGPEPFIPKVDGTILPSGSKLGGQQFTFSTVINAPGATAEAAAMIDRRLAEHEARIPGVILEVTREARERGIG